MFNKRNIFADPKIYRHLSVHHHDKGMIIPINELGYTAGFWETFVDQLSAAPRVYSLEITFREMNRQAIPDLYPLLANYLTPEIYLPDIANRCLEKIAIQPLGIPISIDSDRNPQSLRIANATIAFHLIYSDKDGNPCAYVTEVSRSVRLRIDGLHAGELDFSDFML